MTDQSAGILMYRYHRDELEVLLVHPGGPFWVKKDLGAWSIPKGAIEANEEPLAAARREFQEETGFAVAGEFVALGEVKQRSKKIIHAWAVRGDLDASQLHSNTFEMEWPRHSGQVHDYPEIDKGAWFNLPTARRKIISGQLPFLDKLAELLSVLKDKDS